MEDLKTLLVPFMLLFAISGAILIISALRNRVLFKMAARNVPRRPANTLLTVLGLMLAAMIFSASFATGDTLTHSIRKLAVDSLGETDIIVMREGLEFGGAAGGMLESTDRPSYFDEVKFNSVNESLTELKNDNIVAGVAPIIMESVPAVAPSGLNEPTVTLLGFDSRYMSGFEPLEDEEGNELSLQVLEALGEGYVYINADLAQALEADIESTIEIYLGNEETSLTIAGIYENGGKPSAFRLDANATAVMPLSEVQALRGSSEINYIIITNQGGEIDGASHSEAVMEVLEPALEGTGLKAESIKKETLDEADEGGAMFSTVFLVLGSFSMIAGILLIFLIFVMLAAERKQELGIARAIGTQRGHIIRLFTFEGVLYALIASAIGSGLGVVISWAGMAVLDATFKELGFRIVFDYTASGVIISYLGGVLFTLFIVVISAWRVSRLNIICAIKDIPEPKEEGKHSWKGIVLMALFILVGSIMTVIGIQETQWAPYSLGVSLLIIGLALLARKRPLRLPDRPAFTLAGIGLLFFWLSPTEWHPKGEDMGAGFEMFILTGVVLVTAAVWIVMYNSDLLLKAIMYIFGRLRAITPMIKTAVSYPMASRFRTGMAMAMFALIIFTLIFMSALVASIQSLLDDTDRVTGSFHIRGEVSYNNPINDMYKALADAEGVDPDDFEAIASFNGVLVSARDASGTGPAISEETGSSENEGAEDWVPFFLMGANADYTETVTYDFEIINAAYPTKEDVWKALTENPSVAVASGFMVPSQNPQMGEDGLDLVIGEGEFVIEDDFIPDNIYLEVRNPFTGKTEKLQIIGVIDTMSGPYAGMVTTSQAVVNDIGGGVISPTSYRFKVTPENVENIPEIAKTLEKNFAENGMNTEIMEEEVKNFMDMQEMFFNLMMAFMGLGLIVGIAALGVIAARSVVERRQQIGMLRAIGFQQGMIQFTFLLESSFVALLGIGLGVALGAGTAQLFMGDADIEGIKPVVPWGRVGLIVGVAYVASLFTTFLPAYRAARIYPAEALRYE